MCTCVASDLHSKLVEALQNNVTPLKLNKDLAVIVAQVCITTIEGCSAKDE